ncbi:haloacid dehalogenase [Methanoculleus taiwanensis]|uniref:Haloacid dehalogenase n=2 Tax=Methanoculleus taiwanensis TaxID=1550565 RepID=A0A498H0L8_9EURY|nr:haloacid dehalogenase [Methanoculleus taiwanensis]
MQKACRARDREITTVLFDMDNTLFDFVSAKREACRCIVEQVGAGNEDELFGYFLRGVHGFEDHGNIRDYLATLDLVCPETFATCCRIYEEVKLACITPYPGVETTLCRLRDADLTLAVVTDAESGQATRRLTRTGLLDHFEIVVTPDISGKRKPAPDSFRCALARCGAEPHQAMMVGDSPNRDIAPGRELGMLTAFARYGDWRSGEKTEPEADFVLTGFSALLDHLGLGPDRTGGQTHRDVLRP